MKYVAVLFFVFSISLNTLAYLQTSIKSDITLSWVKQQSMLHLTPKARTCNPFLHHPLLLDVYVCQIAFTVRGFNAKYRTGAS